jgi:hypothetical protein
MIQEGARSSSRGALAARGGVVSLAAPMRSSQRLGIDCQRLASYQQLMEHLYWDLGSFAGDAQLEVTLRGSTARVMLMDRDEYQAYLDGGEYEFYGGFFDFSPLVLEVPYDAHWYLVVDSNPRRITVQVEQIFD